MNMSAKNDNWDQEYTPKSKKYFLVSCDLLLYLSIYEKQSHLQLYMLQNCTKKILSKSVFLSLQHSERDGEAETKMMDTRERGRGNALRTKGRFILRRATNTNTTNNTSPKWAHDKFQATDNDEGEQQGEDVERDQ